MERSPSSSLLPYFPSPSLLSSPSAKGLPAEDVHVSESSPPSGLLFEATPSLKCSFRDTKMAVCIFCLFVARLLVIPLWTMEPFIPVLSPAYGQGQNWLSSAARTVALLSHISLGIVMLCAGLHQLQRDEVSRLPATSDLCPSRSLLLRKRFARWHRPIGRLYVLSGMGVIVSLQVLLPTLGQGVSQDPNVLLVALMETCCVVWLLAVFSALLCIRRGNIALHRRLMRLSYAVTLMPMTQRFLHLMLVPLSLLVVSAMGAIKGRATWLDTRDYVWSLPGYGRADDAMLPFSSWLGLLLNLGLLGLDDRRRSRVPADGTESA